MKTRMNVKAPAGFFLPGGNPRVSRFSYLFNLTSQTPAASLTAQ